MAGIAVSNRKCPAFDAVAGTRRCARCVTFKPLTEFSVSCYRNGVPYLRSYCKPCARLQRQDWYYKKGGADWHRDYSRSHPGKFTASSRRSRLKTVFGLTPAGYEAQLASQGGVCELCKRPPTKKRLAVDHDHDTGKRRGLLCGSCNTALGCFQDSPESLRAAANYLERYQ